MLRVALGFLVICILVSAINFARADSALFSETLKLSDGRLLVVEEQSLEPRSMGSYGVRLYGVRNPEYPYDDFLAGLIHARDGVLTSARELEATGGQQRVLITLRSVGSGSYASYHLLLISDNNIELIENPAGFEDGGGGSH